MPRSEIRRISLLSSAAYAGMFVFGIVMALLGAILPILAGHLQFKTADIGTLFLVMNAAMLASNLALGLAMDRFGMKPPLVIGSLFVAAALVLIMQAGTFGGLLPATVLLGIGGAALNGGTNTLVADLHEDPKRKSAALNVLGVFFGFGALFLPFAIGALLASVSLAPLLLIAAALCAAAGLFAASLRFPAPKQGNALPIADVPRFLRSPLVIVFALLLFFESGVEVTLGGFISTYLTKDMAVESMSEASWILAGYWASIMIARVVQSRLALGFNPYRMLYSCAAGACVGAVLAAIAPNPLVSAFAVVICGESLAGIYPAALGIAGSRFQSHSGTVFGILFTVALGGGMIFPWVSGHVGGAIGLRWVFGIIATAFAIIAILSRVAARIERDQSRGVPA